jgi:hypothetical protein
MRVPVRAVDEEACPEELPCWMLARIAMIAASLSSVMVVVTEGMGENCEMSVSELNCMFRGDTEVLDEESISQLSYYLIY